MAKRKSKQNQSPKKPSVLAPLPSLQAASRQHQQGQLVEAEEAYRRILQREPRQAKAHFLLGLLLHQTGRAQDALDSLRQAVKLAPQEPIFHSGLGLVCRGLKQFDEAIAGYRQALALNPNDADDHFQLGLVYMQMEDLTNAAEWFERAIRLQPDNILWQLERDGLCPAVMPSVAAIDQWRARYAKALARYPSAKINLRQTLPTLGQASVYPPFNLPYHGQDDLPLKTRFADIFAGETAVDAPPAGPPYRIGFVVTRNHERIFLSLMGGILNHLTDPDLEPVIIAPRPGMPRLKNGLTNTRISYLPISEELPLAVPQIKAANLHLIYYWEVGSDALNYFLPFFRPAPVQCTSWGLSGSTGIPQMDYFISSKLLESDGAEAHYSETLVKLTTLPTCFPRPEIPNPLKPRAAFGLPDDATLYFCPQNLFKIHPDFDPILAEILRRDRRGHLLLLETKTPRVKEALRQRFETTLPDVLDRVQFLPRRDFPDFMNLLALADVLLDTIHYSGGNTTHEALATGVPIVTMPTPWLRGRLTLGRFNQIGVRDTVVNSPEEYTTMAVRLGTDRAFRDQIRAKILAANDALYDDRQAVREFEQFFKDAIQKKVPGSTFNPPNPEHETLNPKVPAVKQSGIKPQTGSPTVSLCMIVKNEAANLADCLRSVGNFPTEIIIVDTGSTDRTIEIAQSFGARVEHFTWIDDFAAARNESIKYANGDWVFWLDADDRLPPESVIKLKQVVASGQADAYRCRMVSKIGGNTPTISTVYYTLLFRNHRGVRFEDPLHESPTANLLGLGLTVAHTDIIVNHTGYSGGPEQLKGKARRNMKILQRCVENQPDNMKWQYHLGLTSYQLEDYAATVQALERVTATPSPMLERDTHIHQAYKLLISAYTSLGQPDRAEDALQRALAVFKNRRHMWITGGLLYLYLNRPEKAIELLTHARTLSLESDAVGDAWAPGFLEEKLTLAYQALGMQAMQQQNYRAAVGIFAEMSDIAPPAQQAEAFKLLAMALQKNGQKEEALIAWQAAKQVEG